MKNKIGTEGDIESVDELKKVSKSKDAPKIIADQVIGSANLGMPKGSHWP